MNGGGDLDNGTEIAGATDGTRIGNVADALKVTAVGTSTVGETELATFHVLAENTAIGNNKSMLSIVNDGGSSVVVKIREIRIVNNQTTAITGVMSEFQLRRISGHTSGTSITPLTHDTSDSLNASVTAATGSTVSGESSLNLRHWKWSSDEWGVGASDVEAFDHTETALVPLYGQPSKTKPITLRAGEGLTIKHITNSTAGAFDISVLFTQE